MDEEGVILSGNEQLAVRLDDAEAAPAPPVPDPVLQQESPDSVLAPAGGAPGWLTRWGIGPVLAAADLLAVAIGVLGFEAIGRAIGVDSPARKIAAFGIVLLALVWLAGLYRSRLSLSVLDDLPALAGRWLAAVGLAVLGQIAWSRAVWQDYVIDWQFLWGALAAGVAMVVLRAVGYAVVRRLRARRVVAHRALVLGAGRIGHQVADILTSHPEYGLEPVGFVDSDPILHGGGTLPVLGSPRALTSLLAQHQVGAVVVAFSSIKESDMVGVIRACDRYRCELFVVPRLFELQHVHDEMDNAWGLPLVRLRRATYRSRSWRVKRLIDVAVSATALLLLAPVMLLLAA
ncbi:nucleoside-diphosphate sugar epimerase/dehydratase, partial [Geodermatophilus sabuli]|nr:FlaA1/EpsC-like NDP-sugar epimerase [Geodermatophilus sabuli]